MKRKTETTDEMLRRFIGRYGNPSEEQVDSEVDKAWRELQAGSNRIPADVVMQQSVDIDMSWRLPRLVLAGALAAVVVAVAMILPMPEPPVATRDGHGIRFEEAIRSRGEEILRLADGSRIEMRSGSEVVLERAKDGVRIRLNAGNIIVTAAEQKAGHLYVQTEDLLISIVGTVFMVSAEETGSRVAVIQGEVEIQQGLTSTTLVAGEQVATGESMPVLPLAAKISWSRSALEHLALLEQNAAARPPAPARQVFAATSIKPIDPGVGSMAGGFGCRGVDGKRVAPFGETGEPEFVIPMGRCIGEAVVASLVAFAYNVPHRFGPNVPEWAAAGTPTTIQLDGPDGPFLWNARIKPRFQIDAVAANAAAVTSLELQQMVQMMLADRFKLEVHRETQEVPGYVLSVGKAPLKLKEVSGDPTPLNVDFKSSRGARPTVRGRSTIDHFMTLLMGFTNPSGYVDGELPAYIANRTGLTGIYEWEFVLPTPGGSGGRGGGPPANSPAPVGPPSASNQYAWRGPAMAAAVEEQLGLLMTPQNVPVEVLVVDRVEKPSPN